MNDVKSDALPAAALKYKLERLLTETVGVQDDLDRLYLRMDARGDAAARFAKTVKRIHGETRQLAVRIREIRGLIR